LRVRTFAHLLFESLQVGSGVRRIREASMWSWSKKAPDVSADVRETFFGDVPLSTWAAGKDAEPWTAFAAAESALQRGDRSESARVLQSIIQRTGLESRHYLQAWNVLRQLGHAVPSEDAKHVYGVVVDVPMKSGFDTLAAYEDRSARYVNFSGAAIIWDAPDSRMDDQIRTLLSAGQRLAMLIGPWKERRPPLTPRQARISLLTPSGLHFGQGPFEAFARDLTAAPVIAAATSVMQSLIKLTDAQHGTA